MCAMNRLKPTDFAQAMAKYLLEYLPDQKGLSQNTIQSYSDCLSLFLEFCEKELKIIREKLEIKNMSCEIVERFYLWLETEKKNTASTRNQRRVAINTFFKYLQYLNPGYVLLSQQIRSIPHKKDRRQTVQHLPMEAVEAILKQPNLNSHNGRRDFALLSLMYETAARVSEIARLRIGDIRFEKKGATVHLLGKGPKPRDVPIIADIADFLRKYIDEEGRYRPCQKQDPLFCNREKGFLTRAGITYVLHKYADDARSSAPELIPTQVYPHILRHSRSMHWLEAGVDLQYIKDLLGHADIATTEIYARLSVEKKRRLLEEVHPANYHSPQYPSWNEDKNLMEWLRGFQS
jgi:site-specific recombinase XerD